MPKHSLKGFPCYFVFERNLYRKAYKTKSKSCIWQYRAEREIKQTTKNKIKGFWLIKYNKRYFVTQKNLINLISKQHER